MLVPTAAGLLLFYLTVVAPVVNTARTDPLELGESPARRLITTFEDRFFSGGRSEIDPSFYAQQLEHFFLRQFDPAAVGYLVDEVRAYGYQYGETMRYAWYAFIPRVLWPDKPTVTRGAWFAAYTGFARSEDEARASFGITAIGELFWNFGPAGVLVGMLIVGAMFGTIWRIVGPDPRADAIRMLFYVVLTVGMPNMAEFVTVVVSIAGMFVFLRGALMVVSMFSSARASSGVDAGEEAVVAYAGRSAGRP